MQRVAIIGSSGSGKSTLALQLHQLLHLPVYHLDQYNWLPGWQQRPFEEFAQEHAKLCQREQWIIEGIYTRTFEERIRHADTVIYLDFSRLQCVWRVIKRLRRYNNKPTPTSAPGCYERLDFKFLWYVWNFDFYYKTAITSLLHRNNNKNIYVLHNQKQIKKFYTMIKNK